MFPEASWALEDSPPGYERPWTLGPVGGSSFFVCLGRGVIVAGNHVWLSGAVARFFLADSLRVPRWDTVHVDDAVVEEIRNGKSC